MTKNPNIPYETYSQGEYVSLPSAESRAVPLIRARDYADVEARFLKLPPDMRQALLGAVGRPVSQTKGAAVTPRFLEELQKKGIGHVDLPGRSYSLDADTITILRDIRHGKTGFASPVYNVNGRPVTAHKFDDAGRLDANIARIYGVPADPAAAVARRVTGIRRALLQASPARPAATAPAAPR
jgi:hypothetical protein